MSDVQLGAGESPTPTPRPAHPHPGEVIPKVAWLTFVLGAGSLVVLVASTIAGICYGALPWVTIPLNAAAIYGMFMVAHEGLHGTLSTVRWVNPVISRIAWAFFLPYICLPAFTYAHMEHHRNANDAAKDPDMFANHGPGWQLPFRWLTMDAFYAVWYFRHLPERLRRSRQRPLAEIVEGAVVFPVSVAVFAAMIATGHLATLVIVFVIPQRVAMLIIGWWFDWLPHHGLEVTQRENRYQATRLWVGAERVLLPLMLSQTYHLVHHLHPGLPFYRMWRIWRRNEDAYLAHDPAIATVFGTQMDAESYRRWRAETYLGQRVGDLPIAPL